MVVVDLCLGECKTVCNPAIGEVKTVCTHAISEVKTDCFDFADARGTDRFELADGRGAGCFDFADGMGTDCWPMTGLCHCMFSSPTVVPRSWGNHKVIGARKRTKKHPNTRTHRMCFVRVGGHDFSQLLGGFFGDQMYD